MKITKDKVVSIHYTLTNDEGAVLDSSRERGEPLKYIQGHKNLIVGMENGLEGREKGDKFVVAIKPEEGYGVRNEALVQKVPVDQFGGAEVTAGMRFNASTDQGTVVVKVTEVAEGMVTVDANHDLAGVNLNFDVEVVDVRDAEETELSHGHVH